MCMRTDALEEYMMKRGRIHREGTSLACNRVGHNANSRTAISIDEREKGSLEILQRLSGNCSFDVQ